MQIALQEDAVNASEIFTRGKSDRDISLGASYSTRYYLFSFFFVYFANQRNMPHL